LTDIDLNIVAGDGTVGSVHQSSGQTLSGLCLAQGEPVKLPVRRVVLYKNGVGYFEHTGRVRRNQDLKVDFTDKPLNDASKSLTLVSILHTTFDGRL
jgi:hypothetical protein